MFLTDVLLFTHLVHLPEAYASKTLQWSYALRSFKEISHRLGLFETVRRAFKVLFEDRMSDSSCCRQIRRRIRCRYGVQIYLSENRYILADKDRRSISITHTPKQYNNRNIYTYFCSKRKRSVFLFKRKKKLTRIVLHIKPSIWKKTRKYT